MDLDLNDMILFKRVVEAGSFSAAARELEVHKQTISRRIASLEQSLGARLLQRDTRKMRLTEVGEEIYAHTRELAKYAKLVEQTAQAQGRQVQGVLRMSAPPMFAETYLSPIIREYLAEYPEVHVDIILNEAHAAVIEGGFDLAVCVGELEDSSLVAQRLGHARSVCCASPEYLQQALPLRNPSDLEDHRCIAYGCGARGSTWTLERRGKVEAIEFEPTLRSSSMRMALEAAIDGLGIARLPVFACREALDAGELVPVLEGWRSDYGDISAVYPSRKHVSAKVRAFLNLLKSRLPKKLG